MKMQSGSVKKLIWLILLLVTVGCAPRAEFQTIPQQGASRTGVYPRFSNRPHAETEQFSKEDKARLIEELDSDAMHLRGLSHSRPKAVQSGAKLREDAKREAEETLRQIRKSGQP